MKSTITPSTCGQVGYYTLYVARDSTDDEGRETIPHLLPLGKPRHKMGGYSDARTRATTYAYTHSDDRDNAERWLVLWAAENGLPASGIIGA